MECINKTDITNIISELYGREVDQSIVDRILERIPKKISNHENVEIITLKNFNEYKTYLLLYDKVYTSRMHQYGEQERIIFSLVDNIKAGLIKNHRIMNNRGMFENYIEEYEATIPTDEPNIMVIKSIIWDSLKDGENKTIYTIVIYNKQEKGDD